MLTAGDGEEAINVFQQHQHEIQVVITDLDLPKFGGDELCRRITIINPSIPLIVASGFIDPGMEAQVFGDGVKGFLQKPYKANEVISSVRRVLDHGADIDHSAHPIFYSPTGKRWTRFVWLIRLLGFFAARCTKGSSIMRTPSSCDQNRMRNSRMF